MGEGSTTRQLAHGILPQRTMVTRPLWFLSLLVTKDGACWRYQIIPQVSWILEYGLPRFGSRLCHLFAG